MTREELQMEISEAAKLYRGMTPEQKARFDSPANRRPLTAEERATFDAADWAAEELDAIRVLKGK